MNVNNLLEMHLKLLQKEQFKKQQKKLVILLSNKITIRITKVSKTSTNNNSETNEEEILREEYILSELIHKSIDDLRLK